ncbi:DUF465 domain-containing protein [Erythrobacteraceae bacterium CFH 75059]|uniref:YdcH family protein n=1 Tax=Qipengyuania thermophila TaxID=2509361 RepID=UPI0010224417|nr:YdcH family protein [Qipengyuania thermophila]TCD04112.1 DUF465 domain-containing protein [Erythrobacteraceae bacterium CFH 75059]
MHRSSHMQTLETRHAGLEERLRQEQSRPFPDAVTIKQLKQQKLRIKEQLAQG